ncbi:MAG TPA: transposase [Candidatus Binatia bacterium]|nr:transposase [Candidatus Binatia bacterium]
MRVEVLEGAERRRRWSHDEKMRIVAETLQPGVKVTTVARRNKVASSLVFTWRRLARTGQLGAAPEPAFVPVQIAGPAASPPSVPVARGAPHSAPSSSRRGGLIEIDLPGGRRVRVDAQFDAEALSRVLDLLERR